jgi:ABC-type dipeptide/oligopeptide/nickel transport system permease subunit
VIHRDHARRRLVKSRRAVFGLVLLGLLALAGIFAEVLASPAPVLAWGPAGVSVLPGVVHAADYDGRTRADVERLHHADAVVWPWVRFGPNTPGDAGPDAPADADHPLGTDAEGRDLFARLVYGARTALGLSLFAVLLGMLLGVALGGLAGYQRGFWDDRLVRLVETVDTFPAIIVVALVRAIERQPSALSLVLAVAFVRWAEVARLVRVEVVRAATLDYVTAAHALGASPARILTRHIMPNAIGPAVVSSVFGVASVVLLEAAISFLGMGAESRVASWGETLAEGARDPAHARLLVYPGVLLVLTVGGTYLLAAALRDATDPQATRSR